MAKYECCGLMYDDSEKLTSHMRKDHNVAQFDVALACCGTTFVESKQLSEHMKVVHRIDMGVEI
ncbi:MAG TPA: C2H2-type zinc finger protein [Nitrososphaerales archaeon]|jgi:lipid A disaccharide synthetase|nr:C2H2-type zinc finger protein [Nitrososphaerales archaeon]